MSCGKPVDEEDTLPEATTSRFSNCTRCKSDQVVIQAQTTAFCQDCFNNQYRYKFRRTFANARRDVGAIGNKALIAFSGSASSFALLNLAIEHVPKSDARGPPPLIRSFELVYVDDAAPTTSSAISPEDLAARIQSEYGITLHIHRLEELFDAVTAATDRSSTNLNLRPIQGDRTPSEYLQVLLAPLSPTSRASLVAALRKQLLEKLAKEKQLNLILSAETSTNLAARTLSGIAQGRGFGLGEDVAPAHRLSDDLVQMRPLATMLENEITLANKLNNVQVPPRSRQKVEIGSRSTKADINVLVGDFVDGLQESFPSTVFTISRTAEKLGLRTRNQNSKDARLCAVCGLPAEKDASNWRAANAITSFSETVPTEEKSGLAQTICYACLVILANPTAASHRTEKELLPLPDAVLRRAKMREEIGDFLLEEDA